MSLWTDIGNGWQRVSMARASHPSAAFLCCPGPSLAREPVDSLPGPGRVVYAVNSAYSRVRPDVWVGLDRTACHDSAVWFEPFQKITRLIEGDNDRVRFCPNVFYADLEAAKAEEMFIRRGDDAKFVWTKSTLMFALHHIVWSGFKRVYFVGCDMGGESDYHDGRELSAAQRIYNRKLYAEQVNGLERLTMLAKHNGIAFESCTPNSPLNRFMPFVEIDEAIRRSRALAPQGGTLLHALDAEPTPPIVDGERNVVLVLRSGGEYQPEHVARLAGQIANCKITVLTDFPEEEFLDMAVSVVPMKHDWSGWWSKMELFDPAFGFNDRPFLYLDLDTTVHELPDAFFSQRRSTLIGPFQKQHDFVQSGVMLLYPRERAQVWRHWKNNPQMWMGKYKGDQNFIGACGVEWLRWQDVLPDAVASYRDHILTGKNYEGEPLDNSKIKVLCYYQHPRPWHLESNVCQTENRR